MIDRNFNVPEEIIRLAAPLGDGDLRFVLVALLRQHLQRAARKVRGKSASISGDFITDMVSNLTADVMLRGAEPGSALPSLKLQGRRL